MVAESGHQQDTSAAVGASDTATPSQPAPKRRTEQLCRIVLMDGNTFDLTIDKRAKGEVLLKKVVDHQKLLESDYFGLTFREEDDTKVWLQKKKRISKQIGTGGNRPWIFFFEVRFYPQDPNDLSEAITRYYLALQVRNDIAEGRLPCSFLTYALLGSFIVQGTVGDYDPDVHGTGTDYLRPFPLAPAPIDPLLLEKVVQLHKSHRWDYTTGTDYLRPFPLAPAPADPLLLEKVVQLHKSHRWDYTTGTDYLRPFPLAAAPVDPLLLEKVVQLHKSHRGETPESMENQYLDKAKRLALYGVERHPAKDSENGDIWLGVCATGILVYKDQLRVNRFAWPKIMKVSFRRNIFYIKLVPGEFEQNHDTVGFRLPSQKAAKRLWRSAVEHHAFFRLMSPDVPAEKKSLLSGLGSTRYRYTGRTQYQSRLASSLIDRPQPTFARSMSTRLPTASSYSIVDNGFPQSRSVPLNQGFHSQPYADGGDRKTPTEVFTVETFPEHLAGASHYGGGDGGQFRAAEELHHQDPTSAYRPGGDRVRDVSADSAMQQGTCFLDRGRDHFVCPHGRDRWHRACVFHPRRVRRHHPRAHSRSSSTSSSSSSSSSSSASSSTSSSRSSSSPERHDGPTRHPQGYYRKPLRLRKYDARLNRQKLRREQRITVLTEEARVKGELPPDFTGKRVRRVIEFIPPALPQYSSKPAPQNYIDPSTPYYGIGVHQAVVRGPARDNLLKAGYDGYSEISGYTGSPVRVVEGFGGDQTWQKDKHRTSPDTVTASVRSVNFAHSDEELSSTGAKDSSGLCGPLKRGKRPKRPMADMDYFYSKEYDINSQSNISVPRASSQPPPSYILNAQPQYSTELRDPTSRYQSADASFFPSHFDPDQPIVQQKLKKQSSKSRSGSPAAGPCAPFSCVQGTDRLRLKEKTPDNLEKEHYAINTFSPDVEMMPSFIHDQIFVDQTRPYDDATAPVARVYEAPPVVKTPDVIKKTPPRSQMEFSRGLEAEFATSTPVADSKTTQRVSEIHESDRVVETSFEESVQRSVSHLKSDSDIDLSHLDFATFIPPAVPPSSVYLLEHVDPTAGLVMKTVQVAARVEKPPIREIEVPVQSQVSKVSERSTPISASPVPTTEPEVNYDKIMPSQNERSVGHTKGGLLCGPLCGMIADKNRSDAYDISKARGPNTFMAPLAPPSKTYSTVYSDPTEKYIGDAVAPVYLEHPPPGRTFGPQRGFVSKDKKPPGKKVDMICAPCLAKRAKIKQRREEKLVPFKHLTFEPPEQGPVDTYSSGYYDPTHPYSLAEQVEEAARLYDAQFATHRKLDFSDQRRMSFESIQHAVDAKKRKQKATSPPFGLNCASCIASKQKKQQLASVPEKRPFVISEDLHMAANLHPPGAKSTIYFDPTMPYNDEHDRHVEPVKVERQLVFSTPPESPEAKKRAPGSRIAIPLRKVKKPSLICAPCARDRKAKKPTAMEIPFEQPKTTDECVLMDPCTKYSRDDIDLEIQHPHVLESSPPRLQLRSPSVDSSVKVRKPRTSFSSLICAPCRAARPANKKITAEEIPYERPAEPAETTAFVDPTGPYEHSEAKHPHLEQGPPRQLVIRSPSVESEKLKKPKTKARSPSLICAPCLGTKKKHVFTAEEIPYEKPTMISTVAYSDQTGPYDREDVQLEVKHAHVTAEPPKRFELRAPPVEVETQKKVKGRSLTPSLICAPCASKKPKIAKKRPSVVAEEIPYVKPATVDTIRFVDPSLPYDHPDVEIRHPHVTIEPVKRIVLESAPVDTEPDQKKRKARSATPSLICAPCVGKTQKKKPKFVANEIPYEKPVEVFSSHFHDPSSPYDHAEVEVKYAHTTEAPRKLEIRAASDESMTMKQPRKLKVPKPSLICAPCTSRKPKKVVTAEEIPYTRPTTIQEAKLYDPTQAFEKDAAVYHSHVTSAAPRKIEFREPSLQSLDQKKKEQTKRPSLICAPCAMGKKKTKRAVTAEEIPYEPPAVREGTALVDPSSRYARDDVEVLVQHPHESAESARKIQMRSPSLDSLPRKKTSLPGLICAPCKGRRKAPDAVDIREKVPPAAAFDLIESIPPGQAIAAGHHDPTMPYVHAEGVEAAVSFVTEEGYQKQIEFKRDVSYSPPIAAAIRPEPKGAKKPGAKLDFTCGLCQGKKLPKVQQQIRKPKSKRPETFFVEAAPDVSYEVAHFDPTDVYAAAQGVDVAVRETFVTSPPKTSIRKRSVSVSSIEGDFDKPKKASGLQCLTCGAAKSAKAPAPGIEKQDELLLMTKPPSTVEVGSHSDPTMPYRDEHSKLSTGVPVKKVEFKVQEAAKPTKLPKAAASSIFSCAACSKQQKASVGAKPKGRKPTFESPATAPQLASATEHFDPTGAYALADAVSHATHLSEPPKRIFEVRPRSVSLSSESEVEVEAPSKKTKAAGLLSCAACQTRKPKANTDLRRPEPKARVVTFEPPEVSPRTVGPVMHFDPTCGYNVKDAVLHALEIEGPPGKPLLLRALSETSVSAEAQVAKSKKPSAGLSCLTCGAKKAKAAKPQARDYVVETYAPPEKAPEISSPVKHIDPTMAYRVEGAIRQTAEYGVPPKISFKKPTDSTSGEDKPGKVEKPKKTGPSFSCANCRGRPSPSTAYSKPKKGPLFTYDPPDLPETQRSAPIAHADPTAFYAKPEVIQHAVHYEGPPTKLTFARQRSASQSDAEREIPLKPVKQSRGFSCAPCGARKPAVKKPKKMKRVRPATYVPPDVAPKECHDECHSDPTAAYQNQLVPEEKVHGVNFEGAPRAIEKPAPLSIDSSSDSEQSDLEETGHRKRPGFACAPCAAGRPALKQRSVAGPETFAAPEEYPKSPTMTQSHFDPTMPYNVVAAVVQTAGFSVDVQAKGASGTKKHLPGICAPCIGRQAKQVRQPDKKRTGTATFVPPDRSPPASVATRYVDPTSVYAVATAVQHAAHVSQTPAGPQMKAKTVRERSVSVTSLSVTDVDDPSDWETGKKPSGGFCAPCASGKRKKKRDVPAVKKIRVVETFTPPQQAPPLAASSVYYDPSAAYAVSDAVVHTAVFKGKPRRLAFKAAPSTESELPSSERRAAPREVAGKKSGTGLSCAPCRSAKKGSTAPGARKKHKETFIPPPKAPESVLAVSHVDPAEKYSLGVAAVHESEYKGPHRSLRRDRSVSLTSLSLTDIEDEDRLDKAHGKGICAPCAGRSRKPRTHKAYVPGHPLLMDSLSQPKKYYLSGHFDPTMSYRPPVIEAQAAKDVVAPVIHETYQTSTARPVPSKMRRSDSYSSLGSTPDITELEEPSRVKRSKSWFPCGAGRTQTYNVSGHEDPSDESRHKGKKSKPISCGPFSSKKPKGAAGSGYAVSGGYIYTDAPPKQTYSQDLYDPTLPYNNEQLRDEVMVSYPTYQSEAIPARRVVKQSAVRTTGKPKARHRSRSGSISSDSASTVHIIDTDEERKKELKKKKKGGATCAPCGASKTADRKKYPATLESPTGANIPQKLYEEDHTDPSRPYAPPRSFVGVVRHEHAYAGPPKKLAFKAPPGESSKDAKKRKKDSGLVCGGGKNKKSRQSRSEERRKRPRGKRQRQTFIPPAQIPATISFVDHEDPTVPYKGYTSEPVHETYTKATRYIIAEKGARRKDSDLSRSRSRSPSVASRSTSSASLSSSSLDSDVSDISDLYNASLSIEGDISDGSPKPGGIPCLCGAGRRKSAKKAGAKAKQPESVELLKKSESSGDQFVTPPSTTIPRDITRESVRLQQVGGERRRSSSASSMDYGDDKIKTIPEKGDTRFKRRDTLPVALIVLPTTMYLTDHIDPTIDSPYVGSGKAPGRGGATDAHPVSAQYQSSQAPSFTTFGVGPSIRTEVVTKTTTSQPRYEAQGSSVDAPYAHEADDPVKRTYVYSTSKELPSHYLPPVHKLYHIDDQQLSTSSQSQVPGTTGYYTVSGPQVETRRSPEPEVRYRLGLDDSTRLVQYAAALKSGEIDPNAPGDGSYRGGRVSPGGTRIVEYHSRRSAERETGPAGEIRTTRITYAAPDSGLTVITRPGHTVEEVTTSTRVTGSAHSSYSTEATIGTGAWSPGGSVAQRAYNWTTESSRDGSTVAAQSPDHGWTVSNSSLEQREQTGEPETETITETLPDGTVVTRTITKTRVVKQVISRQVIESHGSEEVPSYQDSGRQGVGTHQEHDPDSDGHRVHETHTRSVLLSSGSGEPGHAHADTPGEFVSSQSVTSGDGRTVETVTYKTERDGKTETHTEKRIVVHGEGVSHDAELTAAILEATQMDPNVMVEKIEVRQQRQS